MHHLVALIFIWTQRRQVQLCFSQQCLFTWNSRLMFPLLCTQEVETTPAYPDICFAVDDFDSTFDAVVNYFLLPFFVLPFQLLYLVVLLFKETLDMNRSDVLFVIKSALEELFLVEEICMNCPLPRREATCIISFLSTGQ